MPDEIDVLPDIADGFLWKRDKSAVGGASALDPSTLGGGGATERFSKIFNFDHTNIPAAVPGEDTGIILPAGSVLDGLDLFTVVAFDGTNTSIALGFNQADAVNGVLLAATALDTVDTEDGTTATAFSAGAGSQNIVPVRFTADTHLWYSLQNFSTKGDPSPVTAGSGFIVVNYAVPA